MGREQLEMERLTLSHDLLKNLFLNRLGTARSDHALEARSRLLTSFWALHRGEHDLEDGIDAVAVIETVQRGLAAWPEARAALERFFRDAPERHGYCRTDMFSEASRRCVEGEESLVNVVSCFVREFTALADSSEEERLRRLRDFWDAADEIARTLSSMQPGFGEDARFGDFFRRSELPSEQVSQETGGCR
jgi:hypothetical protein